MLLNQQLNNPGIENDLLQLKRSQERGRVTGESKGWAPAGELRKLWKDWGSDRIAQVCLHFLMHTPGTEMESS